MNIKPTEEQLRDMRNKGMTLYQISREYNTTILDIFQLEKEYGMLSLNTSLKTYYTINKEDLSSMYIDEHMNQRKIAEELGCSQGNVSNMLGYYHIQVRGRGKYTPQQRDSKYDKIVRLRDVEHLTQEEIAEKVGYSRVHVWKILKGRGVQTRGRGI